MDLTIQYQILAKLFRSIKSRYFRCCKKWNLERECSNLPQIKQNNSLTIEELEKLDPVKSFDIS